jgi:hypothetical protein
MVHIYFVRGHEHSTAACGNDFILVKRLLSMNIGEAPQYVIGFADAENVNVELSTSSPC